MPKKKSSSKETPEKIKSSETTDIGHYGAVIVENLISKVELIAEKIQTSEERLERTITEVSVSLTQKMDDGFRALNFRINNVEKNLSEKIDNVDKRLSDVDKWLSKQIDDVDKRLLDVDGHLSEKLDRHIDQCETDITLLKKASNL